MLHHDVGPVPDLALRSLDAPAQVDFLVVEKETLVEEANPVEHATPDNAVGARHPVDLRRLKWIRPRTIYSSKQSRLRKLFGQARHNKQAVEWRGKHSRRRLPGTVGSYGSSAGQAYLRIGIHVFN